MDARALTDDQNELLLTFAELEALAGGESLWPQVRAAMNTRPPADEQVAAAGLASLLVRDLARLAEDGSPQVASVVAQLAQRVGRASVVVGVTHAHLDETVMPLLLCADGDPDERVLVRVAGPGVVALSPLVNEAPVPDQVAILVRALLDDSDGAVLVKPLGALGVTIRKQGEQWEVGHSISEGPAEFQHVTQQEALDAVKACAQKAVG